MGKEGVFLLDSGKAVFHAAAVNLVPFVEDEDAAFACSFDVACDFFVVGGEPLFAVEDEEADIGAFYGFLGADGGELVDDIFF